MRYKNLYYLKIDEQMKETIVNFNGKKSYKKLHLKTEWFAIFRFFVMSKIYTFVERISLIIFKII